MDSVLDADAISRRELMQAGSMSALGLFAAPLLVARSTRPKEEKEQGIEGQAKPFAGLEKKLGIYGLAQFMPR